jgi:amidase
MHSIKQILITMVVIMTLNANSGLLYKNAGELAAAIRTGKVTSEKVVSAFIGQIEKHNSTFNAVVLLNREQALARAREADAALARGQTWGPLHGVPVTVKDNYQTSHMVTTAGYEPLKNNQPKNDANVVELLENAGAIIIGKTNLSILAMDMQCSNQVFGQTNNAWDTTRTSGGSSGGCVTALATGMTPLSVGNDLGGSVRLPAAYSGVYGFKPTLGVIPFGGIQSDPEELSYGIRTMAVAGPLARSVDDLILALDVLAAPVKSNQMVIPIERYKNTSPKIEDLRIAWTDGFGGVPVSAAIRAQMQAFADTLAAAGATVVKINPALDFHAIWKNWGTLLGHQGGYQRSNFTRWLGAQFASGVLKDVPMHQEIIRPISLEKYMQTRALQDAVITRLEVFLDDFDVWLTPASAVQAFPHHQPSEYYGNFAVYNEPLQVDDQELHYYMATQAYTTPFNFTDSPVLSMPIGMSNSGLPIGIQVVGKRFQDFRILAIGKVLSAYAKPMNYPLAQ